MIVFGQNPSKSVSQTTNRTDINEKSLAFAGEIPPENELVWFKPTTTIPRKGVFVSGPSAAAGAGRCHELLCAGA